MRCLPACADIVGTSAKPFSLLVMSVPPCSEKAFQTAKAMSRSFFSLRSDPNRQWFAPVAAGSVPRSTCVVVGQLCAVPSSQAATSQRWQERLLTKAVFSAARVATGSGSAYELEQKFGPNTLSGAASPADWAAHRSRLWDRWEQGNSSILGLLRRGSREAEARLTAVRAVSPLVDRVLAMRFWRYVDPRPLTVFDLVPSSDHLEKLARPENASRYVVFRDVQYTALSLVNAMTHDDTRYDAMSAVWLGLRSSCAIDDIGHYALLFLCWLAARPCLEQDPLFGGVAAELYDFTQHQYSWLALSQPVEKSWRAATRSLQSRGLGDFQFMKPAAVVVRERALVRVLEAKTMHQPVFHRPLPVEWLQKGKRPTKVKP